MAVNSHLSPGALFSPIGSGRATPDSRRTFRSIWNSFFAPSLRHGSWASGAASVLAAAGLFTMSWERFGNLPVASYNMKLPVVLFGLALVVGAPMWARRLVGAIRGSGLSRVLVVLAVVITLYFVVRACFVEPTSAGLAQIASMLSGAAGPAIVALGIVQSRQDLRWVLAWIVRGAVFVSLFGLWQLFAFYTGLPQIVEYTGVGTSGVGGRIAAFSYEPAYFAYFVLLAVGAALAVARIDGRVLPWRTIAFFGVVLGLANVRALIFLIPLIGVLLAVDWRRNRRVIGRAAIVAVPVVLLATFSPVLVQSAIDAAHSASAPVVQAGGAAGGDGLSQDHRSADAIEASNAADTKPDLPDVVPPSAVLDPNEASSNAPRLAVYKATLDVDLQHPVFGVGPGGLRAALGGGDAPTQGGLVVANNIWLQAASDGGIPLLLIELVAVIAMIACWWRSRATVLQPVLATWLGVVLVGGMLTSYFFDIKLWVIGALVVAALRLAPAELAAPAGPITNDRSVETR